MSDHLQAHVAADRLWQAQGASRCRSCKDPVIFIKSDKSGKTMIVNARPDWSKGNIFIVGRENDSPRATVYGKDDSETHRAAGVALHTDHHATCPYVDDHRRPSSGH